MILKASCEEYDPSSDESTIFNALSSLHKPQTCMILSIRILINNIAWSNEFQKVSFTYMPNQAQGSTHLMKSIVLLASYNLQSYDPETKHIGFC